MTSTRQDVRAAIVDAAARLLQEHGVAALTTRAVAQAARVQAPTIYRLFGDKDGLVEAVAEHAMATYVAQKGTTAEDPDPVAAVRAAWRRHVEFGLANPHLYALLGTRAGSAASPATAAGIEVLRARVHRLAAAGLLRVPEQQALMVIHAAGTGTVLALLGAPAEERDPGLSDLVLEAVLGRLLTGAPATADTSPTAVAIAFATLVPELPGLSDAERALLGEWLGRVLAAS